MEDTATVDTGTVLDTQSTETDSAPAEATETQAAPKAASAPSLKELLKREKNDPNVKFTDAELDVLDKHYDNEAKPKTKAKAPEVDPEDADEAETLVSKPKEKVEEDSEEDPEPEGDEADDSDSPEAKAILKEVGAKSLKDAAAKIKELKSKLGGKDAQAVAKLAKEKNEIISSGNALWKGLRENDPQAIAFAEKTFGVKFGGQQQAQAKQQTQSTGERFIDPDKFIDPESAELVEAGFQRQNAMIQQQARIIEELKGKFGTIEQERDRHIQDTVKQQATMSVVDEMAQIASKHPALKGLSGFREIAQSYLGGKDDPRLEAFNELFDIAKEENCSLKAAFDIKRGRDSDFLTATAKQEGIKQAYNQKPNPSLSGQTGGRGEASYQPVTPAQLEKWESDHSTHPDSWYDKEGDLIQSKIPKSAWKIFGFK